MQTIKSSQIEVNVKVETWQDAVRAAGRILVKNDFAEERYIDGMIKLTEELGPYIVIAPGVAIPHARPEEGAKTVGFAILTLDPPIEFGNEDNDPVFLVIGFCSPNAQAHVDLLTGIARRLAEEGFLDRVKSAKTAGNLASLFNNTP